MGEMRGSHVDTKFVLLHLAASSAFSRGQVLPFWTAQEKMLAFLASRAHRGAVFLLWGERVGHGHLPAMPYWICFHASIRLQLL